jgi:2-keto-4-pentenoate hydratase/2-oxohepta-3-ene-1,7-dioic acid hydratase in catechol pathway
MKLVTFLSPDGPPAQAGWLAGDWVIDAARAQRWARANRGHASQLELANEMEALISAPLPLLLEIEQLLGEDRPGGVVYLLEQVRLLAPLPRPRTVRDFYAFETHVKTARAKRGLGMIPEWYEMPVFYFTNPNAVLGPGEEVARPSYTEELDFELEVAAVIGQGGVNIPTEEADRHIAGYMIMNDWSARDIQRREMKVGLGPAKGKDFATSFGPWITTPDELADRRRGWRYHLEMTARVNGQEVARGNLEEIYHTFGQMIEHASRDCRLYPGEVIGSGTVGTGCLLETGALPWLQPGDLVELEVERLGVLTNKVR